MQRRPGVDERTPASPCVPAPLRGDRRWPSHKLRVRITICLSSFIKRMGRRSRLLLGVFAPDARRRAIVLLMKDSSSATRAVVATLSPVKNRLMPLNPLKAYLRRGVAGADGSTMTEDRPC